MSDTKHGWVTPRADGARARCGGPGVCSTCDTEQEHERMLSGLFGAPASKQDAPRPSWLDGGADAVALAREDGSLPAPHCPTCNDQGAVGNILTAEPCPDCSPGSPASTVATEGEKDRGVHKNGFGSVSFKLSDGFTVSCEWSPSEWSVSVPAKRLDRDVAFKELLQEIGRLRAVASAPAAGDALDSERLEFLVTHGAWITWSKDRELCRVFHRDEDGNIEPFMGWGESAQAAAYTARDAIDAAIAQQSQRKEA
ncbi:hypothetical protein [Achromobacter pestifer]|uniref:Uncharacterized protein n=1 Tax=Achromobacter pestifer TaxID=1353889 RepID=A0A6S6YI37_9BURK|nr:hypothetical protein [Achromobacter pestifer]CAB3624479.1 hypothetical protein LMG3431_00022 [Achromobacter pestifer]